MRSLARRPDDRFSTADELRTALLGVRPEQWGDHTVVTGAEALAAAGAANAAAHGLGPGPGSPGDTPGWGTARGRPSPRPFPHDAASAPAWW